MSFREEGEKQAERVRRFILIAVLAISFFLVGGFFWATSTPGESYSGPASQPADTELALRLRQHVETLAAEPRSLDTPTTIIATTSYLSEQFRAFGYDVRTQEVLSPADNLIVEINPSNADAQTLIIGAHYDTAGSSPGADDNASGVAALLELARVLKTYDGRSRLRVQLIAFANEEPPYFKTGAMGSYVHAQSIDDPDRIAGMIALESMGYYSDEPGSQNYPFPLNLRYPSTGNFIAFVGTTPSRSFLRDAIGEFRNHAHIPSVGGTMPGIVQGVDWSDHWGYSRVGIPAFMVTDTAPFRNPHYHRASDTPETLDYARLALVVEALEQTIEAMMEVESVD